MQIKTKACEKNAKNVHRFHCYFLYMNALLLTQIVTDAEHTRSFAAMVYLKVH